MALVSGARLGPYEILAPLGAGGMGQVYRARDTKLGRDVALKILPESFTHDPERLVRFRREAQVLASLSHPHIGAIYGLDEANGPQFLVLELVDGETLANRIVNGSLPVDQALAIAQQIAEALEAAHDKGIIHRDLKPANIALTQDGIVKVLDFGLAKATETASRGAADIASSPTLTSPAMITGIGVILGTAAYMSPEQAEGRVSDKRSDIWAFGCVLYEMLTGKRAFEGEDVSDTIAAVLRDTPQWDLLPAAVDPSIRTLLQRCLEKDRLKRVADFAVIRYVMNERAAVTMTRVPDGTRQASGTRRATLPWILAGIFGATAVGLVVWPRARDRSAMAPVRLTAAIGADASLVTDQGAAAILSPAGASVAFIARETATGNPRLYARRLDQLRASAMSGTDGARNPFFSPDGQWIAFFAGGKVKKVAVTGGSVITICDAPNGRGGTWASDGAIIFSPANGPGVSLMRVSAAGGTPAPLTTLTADETTQRWPQVLPDERGVLYTSSSTVGNYENASLVVQSLSPKGSRKVVQRGGYYGRYVASGHLAYIHEGTLFAVPFDLSRLETVGQPIAVVENLAATNSSGGGQFAISDTGTLVYVSGQTERRAAPIAWLDRTGQKGVLRAARDAWSNLSFAPDGRRLALEIYDGAQRGVWVYDSIRDTLAPFTSGSLNEALPVWTPDGQRIVFASTQNGITFNLYWQRADGRGPAQRLTESRSGQLPTSWHPSGRWLAFSEQSPDTGMDLMILPIEGDEASGWKPGKPTVFLKTPFAESQATFSPDGRWLAYSSNESGRIEVYVRPFPGPGGKWLVSTAGGGYPTWSRNRRELVYGALDQRIMIVPYTMDGDSFRAEKPYPWPNGHFNVGPAAYPTRPFDVEPSGDRIALDAATETQAPPRQDTVVFIFNFYEELRRIVPPTH